MKRRKLIQGLTLVPIAGGVSSMNSLFASPIKNNKFSLPLVGPDPIETTLETFMDESNIYRRYGVEPIINCRGIFTIIGGSIKRPESRAAMEAASNNFAQEDELGDAIGLRLAELTGAEWGVVSSGCAGGLKLVTAAVVSGGDPEKLIRIPDLSGLEKTEVIIPRTSRNAYDHAIRNIGVTIITINTLEELKNAINPKTAMIYVINGDNSWTGAPLSLENIAEVAKPKNIPILFDAANEILSFPPVHLKRGATIQAQSGGKAICGPQSTGLLLGDKDILMSAWQASSPHHGPCRDNKVDRDEMFGLVAAIETWKNMDHDAVMKQWLSYLDFIDNKISGVKSVKTLVHYPSTLSGLSNVSPEMVITWDPEVLNITGVEMATELGQNKPRIAVASGGGRGNSRKINGIAVTTIGMQPGEEKIVAARIYDVLTSIRKPKTAEMKPPKTNVSGNWDITIEFYNSKVKHRLFIDQEDNWIKGIHTGEFAVCDMVGSIEGDHVKLRSSVPLIGDSITYIFSGTVSGDSMSGDIFMGEYRNAKFTAIKDTKPVLKEQIIIPSGAPMAS